MGEGSPVSRRSSTLFGIHSESKALKELKRVRAQNRRFSILAAAAIFLLIVTLICLIVVDIYNNSYLEPRKNRTLSGHPMEHLSDLISAQQWKVVEDIELEPQQVNESERRSSNELGEFRNETKPANHRFDDNEPEPEERMEWKPRPFTLNMDHQALSTNDMESYFDGSKVEETPKLPKGFSPPVRFKGIYVSPANPVISASNPPPTVRLLHQNRDPEYYKKINEFFTNRKKIKPPQEIEDSDSYASDQVTEHSELYTQAIYPMTLPDNKEPEQFQILNRKNNNPKKKPFTVMLDIYPMNKEEHGPTDQRGKRRPKEQIFIPMRPGEAYFKPSVPRHIPDMLLPPKQRRKNSRMLMKLNLFPREQKHQNRRIWNMFSRQEDYDDEEEDEDEEDYEDYEGNCEEEGGHGIVGHNPYGKPITAKWKTKNGEVIHAKYVTMQQWKDRSDDHLDIDPRK